MNPIPASQLRQLLFLLLIAVLFSVLAWNLRGFVPALLGAYTLYVLLRPAALFLTMRWRWPPALASAVLMVASFAVILLPLALLIGQLDDHVVAAFRQYPEIVGAAEQLGRELEQRYGIALVTPENMARLTELALREAQRLVGATLNSVATMFIAYLVLWFMLAGGDHLEKSFYDWLPLQNANKAYVRRQLNDLVYANAVGIPLMGLVQGLAGLLAYWLAGVRDPWLWFGITFLAGMLPVFGAALAYVPLALILLGNGRPVEALLIFLYGFLVIGSIDNLARMWLLKRIGHTHPLITFFGVIAGLRLFGFVGFIFGPIMISLGLLLVKIYEKEFGRRAKAG
jgi:predicted PurR-regulated permease PerM